jgi:hypothetical protein
MKGRMVKRKTAVASVGASASMLFLGIEFSSFSWFEFQPVSFTNNSNSGKVSLYLEGRPVS